jgi:glycosyltransferase involved in cell wall biosynthesis
MDFSDSYAEVRDISGNASKDAEAGLPTQIDSTPMLNTPKSLIVDLSNLYGGASSRVLSMLPRFPSGTVALAGLENSAVTREAMRLKLPIHVLGNHKTDPRILPRLIRLIRKEGFQVLDTQNIQSKFYASLAASFTRVALVSTINSWYENEHGGASTRGKIYTTLELATNQNLALYVTVSEKDRGMLLRSGIPEDKIELIYNAVDTVSPKIEPNFLRTQFNLPTHTLIALAVGRLVKIKGYDVLITAMKEAAQEIPHLACVIIGEGEAREELTHMIEESGLQGRVVLPGYLPREAILSALASCDIFAMPSRYEGTPIALLEAGSMACPIIASNAGGMPELVTHNEHALLVTPEDPHALAQALIHFAKDPSLAKRLGENAQKRVREKFGLEDQVTATMNAYQKAWRRKFS